MLSGCVYITLSFVVKILSYEKNEIQEDNKLNIETIDKTKTNWYNYIN
mgnify:FL=1